MTYHEALQYIHSNYWLGSKPGLSRTRELLAKIGNPQNELRFVHVAGTNGKGSFCAMLACVLTEAGYRVGLFTSPYILTFCERMRINGEPIPEQKLADLTAYIRPSAESMEEKPTEFELITAVAMEYFAREQCDIVVLECGMGGRLDSTNVIASPELSVITGVSLDHTAYLGNTVREIAAQKAGIIKKGRPCLFCGEDEDACAVIREKAKAESAPFHTVDKNELSDCRFTLEGTRFDAKGYAGLFLPLLGVYQPRNALHVLSAVELLRSGGWKIPDAAVRNGLKQVKWPARFEKIHEDPLILFDGGHNPEGVKAATASVKTYFGDRKLLLVTGVMQDKDYPQMVKELASVSGKAFCVRPDNPRALSADRLADVFTRNGVAAVACSSVSEAVSSAVKEAKETQNAVLCVGSLYLYQEVRKALKYGSDFP